MAKMEDLRMLNFGFKREVFPGGINRSCLCFVGRSGALTALKKDAIKPNLMQTLEVSRMTPAVALDWLESTVSLERHFFSWIASYSHSSHSYDWDFTEI